MALDTTTAIIVGSIVGAVVLIVFGLILFYFCYGENRHSTTSQSTKYNRVNNKVNKLRSRSSGTNSSYNSYEQQINTDSEADLTDIEEGILQRNSKYLVSKSRTASTGSVGDIDPNITRSTPYNRNDHEMEPMLIDQEISSDITNNYSNNNKPIHAQNGNNTNKSSYNQQNNEEMTHNSTQIEMPSITPDNATNTPSNQINDKSSNLDANTSTTKTEEAEDDIGEQKQAEACARDKDQDEEPKVAVKNNAFEQANDVTKTGDIHEKQDRISLSNDDHDHGPECHCINAMNASFGESQSPINIITSPKCGKTVVMKDDEFMTNPLRFNYPEKVKNCTILNNGHTVQINIDCSLNQCQLFIHDKVYTLRQFHFHTPSEHLIDGETYEMEMHLVHTNDNGEIAVLGFIFTTKQRRYKPKLKLSQSRMHLVLDSNKMDEKESGEISEVMPLSPIGKKSKASVITPMQGVMEEEQEESDDDLETDSEWESDDEDMDKDKENKGKHDKQGNDFLSQFWDQLPQQKTKEDILLERDLSFDYLFETSSNNFVKNVETNEIDIDMELFEYMGSLTTPPYTEGVQWLVSKRTHFINNKQLYKLSGCWGHSNNARPVQEYFGRKVSLRSKSSLKVIS